MATWELTGAIFCWVRVVILAIQAQFKVVLAVKD